MRFSKKQQCLRIRVGVILEFSSSERNDPWKGGLQKLEICKHKYQQEIYLEHFTCAFYVMSVSYFSWAVTLAFSFSMCKWVFYSIQNEALSRKQKMVKDLNGHKGEDIKLFRCHRFDINLFQSFTSKVHLLNWKRFIIALASEKCDPVY